MLSVRKNVFCFNGTAASVYGDNEDPYPSLSDFHDYEPNLEFDDTELEQAASTGNFLKFSFIPSGETGDLLASVACGTSTIQFLAKS